MISYRKSFTKPTGFLAHGCILASAAITAGVFFGTVHMLANGAYQRGRFLGTDRPPGGMEARVAITMDYAINSTEANDVIVFGDSTCFCDFTPALFERQTGLRAFNLGTFGVMSFDGFRTQLERYLRSHPRPRLVVVAVQPIVNAVVVPSSGPKATMRERFFNCYGSQHKRTWQNDVKVALRELRGTMPGFLDAPIEEPLFGKPATYRTIQAAFQQHRGGCLASRSLAEEPYEFVPFHFSAFPLDDALRREARQLVQAAGGIPVAVVFTPISGPIDGLDTLRAELQRLGFDTRHATELQYPARQFADPWHCNRRGAERFTDFMADAFGPELAKPRSPQIVGDLPH